MRTWTLRPDAMLCSIFVEGVTPDAPTSVIELEPVLDLLERAAPQLSYAPPMMVRKGEVPVPKARWLRDEIDDLLRSHGRLQEPA